MSDLVGRVVAAFGKGECSCPECRAEMAEAAIREVLAAMREPSISVIDAVHCLGMPPNYPAEMIAAAVDAFAREHGLADG
jgi:hypothetical protein